MPRTRDGFTDMDWDKLKVFHATAEAGSFTHSGEQLGLWQSAESRQVSALEQELSDSLFHRHARGLILTELGDLLFRTAHYVFMQLQASRAKLTDTRKPTHPDLIQRRLFAMGFHAYYSPEYIKRFGTPRTLDELDSHRIITPADGHVAPHLHNRNWLIEAGRDGAGLREAYFKVNNI